jgi:hypothetical protein
MFIISHPWACDYSLWYVSSSKLGVAVVEYRMVELQYD